MDELIIPLSALAILFFIVALAYSSVGLGGGSSYTALMAIAGVSLVVIPTISLILNLFVTSIGSYHFIRQRHVSIRLILPFLVSSMPMSYLGGSLHLDKTVFQYFLLFSLLLIAARIYIWDHLSYNLELTEKQKTAIALFIGAILGLIAGIVGIGGGIYLVPLIIMLNLGTIKQAAACAVIFIFLNSLTGLIARLTYNNVDLANYWPLVLAVIAGGFVGSRISSTSLNTRVMEKVLGGIILVAIVLLTIKLFG